MENKMASLCRRSKVKELKSRAEDVSPKEAKEELTIKIIIKLSICVNFKPEVINGHLKCKRFSSFLFF